MVITVECPSCASSFPVDPAKIPEGGVNARCSACAAVFRVERPEPVEEPAVEEVVEEVTPEPVHEEPAAATMEAPEAEPEVAGFETMEAPEPEPEVAGFATMEAPDPGPEAEGFGTMEAPAAEEDAGLVDTPDDWVIETEDSGMVPEASPEPEEDAFFSPVDAPIADEAEDMVFEDVEEVVPEPIIEVVPEPEPEAEAAPEPEATPASVQGFTFGKRDPRDKAKRLARVLVSDMIMYNPDRHETALANGTLKDDFEDEIDKSWKEYVEQVGPEMAEGDGQDFWRSALNDVLAKGEQLF